MDFKLSIFNHRVSVKRKEKKEHESVKTQLPGKDRLYSGDTENQQYDMALRILHTKAKQTLNQVINCLLGIIFNVCDFISSILAIIYLINMYICMYIIRQYNLHGCCVYGPLLTKTSS